LEFSFSVFCATENGIGEAQPVTDGPKPDSLTVPGAEYGVNLADPVAPPPHSSGLAIAVRLCRSKWTTNLLNGCSGGSLMIVVSWPVTSLGITSALSLTETP